MTTTTRPLPTDLALLRQHWMPAEPEHTTVTAALDGIRRIDALVTDVVAQLAELDQADRADNDAFVDAAIAGAADLDQRAADLANPGDRPALERCLERLRTARLVATYRHDTARRTDPDYVAWQQQCGELLAEWRYACDTAETPEQRYNALVGFAGAH
jgi:hypothetical protein